MRPERTYPDWADLDPHVRLAHFRRMVESKKIALSFNHGESLGFRWQMYFNRFEVEAAPNGKYVRFAHDGGASEIVSVFIATEGLVQTKASVEQYLPDLAGTSRPGPDTEKMPHGMRRFSPLFSNHVRLSRSGGCAEIAFYTTMLSLIADEVRGRRRTNKGNTDFPLVPVALLHSDVPTHFQLVCRILEDVSDLPMGDQESED